MNSRYYPASVLISAASLLLLAGCGSATKRGQVDGVVVRQGRPVGNVVVTFMPDEKSSGGRAQGVTDAQGRFRLRGEDQKEGALVGTYRVIVEDLAIFDAPRSEDGTVLSLPPPRFPTTYTDPLKTTLRQTIEAGEKKVELDLAGN